VQASLEPTALSFHSEVGLHNLKKNRVSKEIFRGIQQLTTPHAGLSVTSPRTSTLLLRFEFRDKVLVWMMFFEASLTSMWWWGCGMRVARLSSRKVKQAGPQEKLKIKRVLLYTCHGRTVQKPVAVGFGTINLLSIPYYPIILYYHRR
jgi:hypothetical protein